MNKENVLELAEYIELQPREMFDMSSWGDDHDGNPCGAPACIAGHCHRMIGGQSMDCCEILGSASSFLDIPAEMAFDLFEPLFIPGKVTASRAVRQLRHFAETGEVDWDATP